MVYNSLKILQREGYLEFTEEVDSPSTNLFYRFARRFVQIPGGKFQPRWIYKTDLRSYTGLFSGYVIVDEELLAKRAGTRPGKSV